VTNSSYDPEQDLAVLDVGATVAAETTRLAVTPWLTVVFSGDRLVRFEVRDASVHLDPNALLGEPLAGVREAADLFGVQRSNFVRDLSTRPDFPAPVAELASTRVWRRSDLIRYRAGRVNATAFAADPNDPKRVLMGHTRNAVSDVLESRRVSDDARRWLPEMTARLVRRFGPDRIILFGSQAKGEARKDSDVDLLVVMPRLDGHKLDASIAMRNALRGIPLGKDIMVATSEEIEGRGEVRGIALHDALKDGVVLYDRAATA